MTDCTVPPTLPFYNVIRVSANRQTGSLFLCLHAPWKTEFAKCGLKPVKNFKPALQSEENFRYNGITFHKPTLHGKLKTTGFRSFQMVHVRHGETSYAATCTRFELQHGWNFIRFKYHWLEKVGHERAQLSWSPSSTYRYEIK